MNNKKKGFTLLEILLVIASIGILASIVIVAINPLRQIGKAENASRWGGINTVQKALDQYYISNGRYPKDIIDDATGLYGEICDTGKEIEGDSTDCTGKIDLRELVPTYIAEIPRDPKGGGYKAGINNVNNKISVFADKAVLGEFIIINPIELSLVINGTNEVGQTLTVTLPTGLNISEESLIWYTVDAGIETQVGTGISYVVQTADAGKEIVSKIVIGENVLASGSITQVNIPSLTTLWAKSAGGSGFDNVSHVTSDNNDNIIITGYFDSNVMNLGSDINGNPINLNNNGNRDIYLSKYNTDGELLWAKSAGGSGFDNVSHVTSDNNDNIIITGYFDSNIMNLGSDINGNPINLNNNGSQDFYISKYNIDGELLWAKSSGETLGEYGISITSDNDNNIIVTGYFSSNPMSLGNDINGNPINLNNNGSQDFFISKYNIDGELLWAKSAGGNLADYGFSITSDNGNNIIVAGSFQSNVLNLGNDINGNPINLSNNGSRDTYISKYNIDGELLWAKSAGGGGFDYMNDMKLDNDNNIIVAGSFQSNVLSLGNDINGNPINLNNNGIQDFYISKYNIDGELLWARSAGGNDNDYINNIAIDNDNNIIVTGYFSSNPINLGNDINGNPINLNNNESEELHISKYNLNGGLLYSKKSLIQNGNDFGSLVMIDDYDNLIISGYFISNLMSLGNDINGNLVSLSTNGSYDIFILKFTQ